MACRIIYHSIWSYYEFEYVSQTLVTPSNNMSLTLFSGYMRFLPIILLQLDVNIFRILLQIRCEIFVGCHEIQSIFQVHMVYTGLYNICRFYIQYIFWSVNESGTICSHLTSYGSQMVFLTIVADKLICTISETFFRKFSNFWHWMRKYFPLFLFHYNYMTQFVKSRFI